MKKDVGSEWFWPALILLAVVWWASTRSSDAEADRHAIEGSSTFLHPAGRFDEDAAREDATADVSASSFDQVGDTSTCTEDCGGHDAGFEWAKENGVTDAGDCSGSSTSFVEGCEAYAEAIEQKVDDEREEFESGASDTD